MWSDCKLVAQRGAPLAAKEAAPRARSRFWLACHWMLLLRRMLRDLRVSSLPLSSTIWQNSLIFLLASFWPNDP